VCNYAERSNARTRLLQEEIDKCFPDKQTTPSSTSKKGTTALCKSKEISISKTRDDFAFFALQTLNSLEEEKNDLKAELRLSYSLDKIRFQGANRY
jgi:hypothetical protein